MSVSRATLVSHLPLVRPQSRLDAPTVFNTSPPTVTFIDNLEQGQVLILLSIDQTRNLHMTIEHTPQCDKITRKAFGMIRQPIPVSSSGSAMFDLAAFCNQHDARTANRAVAGDKINPPQHIQLKGTNSFCTSTGE